MFIFFFDEACFQVHDQFHLTAALQPDIRYALSLQQGAFRIQVLFLLVQQALQGIDGFLGIIASYIFIIAKELLEGGVYDIG